MKYEGKCTVQGMFDDLTLSVIFNNMKADVHILSVRKLVQDGFDICFTEVGGYIKSRAGGKRIEFIEADGAYWLKIKISPPDDPMGVKDPKSVFSRPGP